MARLIPIAAIALALSFATPVYAHEHATPGDLALEKMQQIIDAMRRMIDEFPLYESPEILDNGDIIIRRKHRDEERPPPEDENETRI